MSDKREHEHGITCSCCDPKKKNYNKIYLIILIFSILFILMLDIQGA